MASRSFKRLERDRPEATGRTPHRAEPEATTFVPSASSCHAGTRPSAGKKWGVGAPLEMRAGLAQSMGHEGVHNPRRGTRRHKTVTFQTSLYVVLRMGGKASGFASFHMPSQRAPRWPKHCLGETYAESLLFSPSFHQGCLIDPSLLTLSLVGTARSSD